MRIEIEINDDTLEAFNEMVEESELNAAQYIGKAVDGLGQILSGDVPAYALGIPIVEALVDPDYDEEEEDDEEEEEASVGAI